jgi:murein DD-endopeptidase MepM/ murein hydrolase activator NlpD
VRRPAALLALLAATACAHRDDPRAARPATPVHAEPDVVGVVHVVRKGESLGRIARAYGLTAAELADVNGIEDPRDLRIGDELFVPAATRPRAVPPPAPGEPPEPEALARAPEPEGARPAALVWPVRGVLASRFGQRNGQPHEGIDVAAPEGTLVTAAAAGRVVFAGRQSGYGSLVILRHAGELLTVYAHASRLLVREGDEVAAGAAIARVGNTGRSTGPHLHFEVREGTRPRDPLRWLRAQDLRPVTAAAGRAPPAGARRPAAAAR